MPTFWHGRNSHVLLAQYDVSSWLNNSNFQQTMDTAETTAYGSNARSYLASFPGGTTNLAGMFDGTAAAIDPILAGLVGATTASPLTIVPGQNAAVAVADRCFVCPAFLSSYNVSSPVNDVVSVTADLTYSARMGSGRILCNVAAAAASVANPNTTPNEADFVASSTGGFTATLHMTANTRDAGSIAIKVQDSADGTTYADVAGAPTFTSVNFGVLSGQTIQFSGTVRQWLGVSFTVTAGTTGGYSFIVGASKF